MKKLYPLLSVLFLIYWGCEDSIDDEKSITKSFTTLFGGNQEDLGFSVQQGFYELVNSNFGYTNIYTNMRGLISDFGIYLNVLLFSFFGIFICLKTYFRANVVEYFFLRLIIMLIIFPFYSIFSFTTSFSSVLISYMILTFYNK